ncbi:hypothetical protein [Bradyrhizobium sp. SHOUNA76]|uniref:hypothetical protein n=1 Tax=Bradyrhizobium sp. SHOUNA76 TaxID=2908927 RepID=UPI001FF488E3|nr:hypothetical protein [Bradyrhizobium sp. SHOUNA76]MCJ9700002.1 hypothetical protein [Bradyrhizobium sp. SHOUNA76]
MPVRVGQADPVAHQAAGHGKLSELVDCGKGVARCQWDDLLAVSVEERIGRDKESVGMLLGHDREGPVKFRLVVCP